jgi:hypothetical protein
MTVMITITIILHNNNITTHSCKEGIHGSLNTKKLGEEINRRKYKRNQRDSITNTATNRDSTVEKGSAEVEEGSAEVEEGSAEVEVETRNEKFDKVEAKRILLSQERDSGDYLQIHEEEGSKPFYCFFSCFFRCLMFLSSIHLFCFDSF